jgi:hypothetical protein
VSGKPDNPAKVPRVITKSASAKAVTSQPKALAKPMAKPSALKSPASKPPVYKANGSRALGSFVPGLTRKAFEKYGFSAATLITDWATIVGRDLAVYTAPERLKWPKSVEAYEDTATDGKGRPGATLDLRVEPARALEVEYRRRQIAERINAYFGYRAIEKIRLLQASIDRPVPRKIRKPTAAEIQPLPGVADDGLRAALEAMGAGIRAKKNKGAT